MAFFEQLGKRLSDAGQTVAQQTKNFADVTQLNTQIGGKEKRINQLYQSIGQAYYEKHKEDASDEDQWKIDEINSLFAEIQQCKEKISQIKGFVKCSNCGADMPLASAFCSSCGAKMDGTDTQTEDEQDPFQE